MGLEAYLAQQPWAITREGMELAWAVATRGGVFAEAREHALSARNGVPLTNDRRVQRRGNVAVINAFGPMVARHASMLSEVSALTAYSDLRQELQAALDDSSVASVMFNFDSPGGEVNGCAELAQAIYDARSAKPTGAYVGSNADSAACWLATACERVYVATTGGIGSIGVLANIVGQGDKGEKSIRFVSSQSPNKISDPSTEAGAKRWQARIDEIAAVFIGDVAKHRGITAKAVVSDFDGGGTFIGANAVRVGLADEVSTFEAALAALSSRGQAAQTKRITMNEEQLRLAALEAFERDVLSIAGAGDRNHALGALRAMKISHEQVTSLTAKVVQLEAAKNTAEFDALLKQGEDARQITPAMASGEWIKSLRGSEHGAKQLTSFLATAPKVVAGERETPREEHRSTPGVEITSADERMARIFCGDDDEAVQKRLEALKAQREADAKNKRAAL